MTSRLAGVGVLIVAVIALIIVLSTGGSSPYKLTMYLDNADGLADGSAVNVGGIPVGSVKLGVDRQNRMVDVTLDMSRKYAPVGRDVTASIVAQNVLGQKQVELDVGDKSNPVASGYVIPSKQITVDTDLDQLLQVLDPQTRARLAVLVNEAGIAFTGQGANLGQVLKTAPDSLVQAANLLQQLDTNNAAISDALVKSNTYIAETTAQRAGLERLVDRVGQASETAATKTAELKSTLATAPGFLSRTRTLLASIDTTAAPLGNAAQLLTKTSTPLLATLKAIDPFQGEAGPALQQAVAAAPELGNLAAGATPVLRQAVPMTHQLYGFVKNVLPGGTATFKYSVDNILAVIENWSRAIQFRDGLSHIFRAEIGGVSPNLLTSAIQRLKVIANQSGTKNGGSGGVSAEKQTPGTKSAAPATSAPSSSSSGSASSGQGLKGLGNTLSGILSNATSGASKALGGVGSTVTSSSTNGGPSSASAATKHLLQFLMGS